MKQADVNRAVARATGETVCTIERLGFLLADPADDGDPQSDVFDIRVIDWDELAAQRNQATKVALEHAPAVA